MAASNCPLCSKPLANGRPLVFRDDVLIHAACWSEGDQAKSPPLPGRTVRRGRREPRPRRAA